jgi:hypothetical protein
MSVPAVRQNVARAGKRPQPALSSVKAVEGADGMAAYPSPARILQERLQSNPWAASDAVEFDGKRWPLYLALPFWLGLSGAMWAAIIGCVWLLLRHG